MDAETGDSAVFGEIVLSEGTADEYYLWYDEFEEELWLPVEGDIWYSDESGQIEYWQQDGDLHIFLYDDFNFIDSILVKDWSDGELGIHLTLIDNRPEGGGNSPLLFDGGGDLVAPDAGNATAGARAVLDDADILEGLTSDEGKGGLQWAMGDGRAIEPAAAIMVARTPENVVSASADEVALMAA